MYRLYRAYVGDSRGSRHGGLFAVEGDSQVAAEQSDHNRAVAQSLTDTSEGRSRSTRTASLRLTAATLPHAHRYMVAVKHNGELHVRAVGEERVGLHL